jgi:GTP-binding protein
MLKIKNAKFIKSVLDRKEKPKPSLPEIAFAGRSNVGKSSLINSLVNQRNFARVSKKPGKTQTINFFDIDNQFYLVDLPGYGFARRSLQQKSNWNEAIEDYLLNSRELLVLFALIDSKVGVKENDQQLIEWLAYNQIPFQIIATKVDQIPKSKRQSQVNRIREGLGLSDEVPVIFFSSKDRTGREEVIKYLSGLLNQLS